MASTEIKTDGEGKLILFCDFCDEDEQTNTARSFCFDCEKYFCSDCEKLHAKFSRNHKTIAGDDLPEAKELDPLMQCASHPKHSVEFYCGEHQSVFCRLCRHIKHGNCEVKDFGTACQEFDLETEFNGALDNLNNAIGQITETKIRGLRQLEMLRGEAEQRKSFIRNFRRELEELSDQYENAGDEYDRANTERANSVLGSVDMYLKQSDEQMRLLEETKGKLGDGAVLVSIVTSNQLCQEYISKVEDIVSDSKKHRPFTFHNENITTLLEKFSILTRAEQSEHTGSEESELEEPTRASKRKSFWNIKACSLNKDSVITVGNERFLDITACLTMANGEVILCDSTYNRLVLMNQTLKFVSDINVQYYFEPFGIAEVDANTVAITVPNEQTVQFVAIKPGLKLQGAITVSQDCYGIALYEKNMYLCTYNDGKKAKGMDQFRSIRNKVKTTSTGIFGARDNGYNIQMWCIVKRTLLKSIKVLTNATPRYISLSSDGTNIFLSGGDGKEPVVRTSKEGHIIYKYFDDTVESPRNIFADDEDNLLVFYAGNRAGEKTGIRVINSGGEGGKDLLLQEESLAEITALHFDKRSDILLVASEDQVDGKTVSKLGLFKLEYK